MPIINTDIFHFIYLFFQVNPTKMITHRFPLSKLKDAIELIKSQQDGVLKVMIDCTKK